MTPQELVQCFFEERKILMDTYFSDFTNTNVGVAIKSLELDKTQTEKLKQVLNGVLTDAFYTVLLGLDGEASIGNKQIPYRLYDDKGNELTGSGEIEFYAYKYFHNG